MQSRKLPIIFSTGMVLVVMLACAIPLPTPVTPTDDSSSPTVTDTPELVLPPPVVASLRVVYSKAGNVWSWTEGGSPLQLTFSGDAGNPRLSSNGQVVAFNKGGELWAVNADGSDVRQLVDLAFMAAYASTPGDQVIVDDILWLNQYNQVVFNTLEITQGAGYQVPLFDFKVADADSGISATASPGEGGVPYLSPDNNVLALSRPEKVILRFMGQNVPYVEIFTFPIVLTYSEWLYVPELVWLPDSSAFRVVVPAHDPLAEPGQVSSFWNVPVSGTPTRLATFVSVPAFVAPPFVSPDGQLVVYQVDNGSNTEIHTITAGGLDTLMLSFPLTTVDLLGWNPDSVHFVFSQPDPVHANLGTAGSSQPLGDTSKVQKIRWVDANRYLFMNGDELRISELGGASVLIDAGVSEYDFVRFGE